MTEKYVLDPSDQITLFEPDGITPHVLTRIRRVADGELGGYIESEANLSQEGECWVNSGNKPSMVYGNAVVSEDANVAGIAYGNARIYGQAQVAGHFYDFAEIYGNANIAGNVYGNGKVYDRAEVTGSVYDDAVVCGTATLLGNAFGTAKLTSGTNWGDYSS